MSCVSFYRTFGKEGHDEGREASFFEHIDIDKESCWFKNVQDIIDNIANYTSSSSYLLHVLVQVGKARLQYTIVRLCSGVSYTFECALFAMRCDVMHGVF